MCACVFRDGGVVVFLKCVHRRVLFEGTEGVNIFNNCSAKMFKDSEQI